MAAGAMLAWTPAAMAQTAPPAPVTAAATKDADPALWVVRDADTTIYLFGTVHVLKPGLSWFDEAVKTAFDKSDEVYLEIRQPEASAAQATVLRLAINQTGPALPERLPAGERAAYAGAVTGLGLPPAAFDRFDPWFAASTMTLVSLQKAGYDPASGAEQVINQAASGAGKPVNGLETLEQQLGYFDALSERSQVALLSETVKQLPEAPAMIDKMVEQWSTGQTDALADTINEGLDATPEVAKLLLFDRNARWATWIQQRMARPGTVFVAVGAGHLAGRESVQDKLAALKIKVERIRY